MRTSIIRNKRINDIILKLAAIVFWLLIWHFISKAVGLKIILPSPLDVLNKLVELVQEQKYWIAVGLSFVKILVGILIGTATAMILSVLTAKFKTFNILFGIPLNVIKSTPVASFIVIALVWVKSAYLATFITSIMVLPIVWSNMHQGISTVDKKLLEVGKCYNFTAFKKVKMIYLPHLRSFLSASITSAAGLGWKAGIAAEVIASPKDAIGAYLNNAKVYLETEEMFAWTATILVLSAFIQYVLKALCEKYIGRGRK